ncbi:MAG: hypothetical protein ACP5HS_02010 [Anaerolineae bacterium]
MTIQRLVYVGDTWMNDGTAFRNLCTAGGWQGTAFIGSETRDPPEVQLANEGDQVLYLANRWSMLEDFDGYCRDHHFAIDAATAVIIDLDKTALGARGRNDHVINEARIKAVRQTVGSLLGDSFHPEQFEASYNMLNRTKFHPFTADNQDYVAYLCLILGSGLISLSTLVDEIQGEQLTSFIQFLERIEDQSSELPDQLRDLHKRIYERVQAGDPTPFKAFRYNEYRSTVGRMGRLELDARANALLAHEIVITQEVREMASRWQSAGALLFGLSDKPDEASVPTNSLAAQGFQPIHRTLTHAVGEAYRALGEPRHETPAR